jgi:hypothetical protein
MLIANDIEIPDDCPEVCTVESLKYCTSCPIFLCRKEPNLPIPRLRSPDSYNRELAIKWQNFFYGGVMPF